ncbi:interferon alpha/beta receptor 2 [Spea bombifrons]|uniref:interferon alpha/beta receptor 2 n=1 Tax=Spea bombifrons TaxID=233779 RepID=UPI00234B8771|nr:interferon alpha/beta receptor 2 [Spea bombifrons]
MSRSIAFITVCHLILRVSSILPPPRNVQLVSKNFQHILTWEDSINNETVRYYNVYYRLKRSVRWIPVDECSNITNLWCDLSDYFSEPKVYYGAIVQSFIHNDVSNVSSSKWLIPIRDTSLGPPIVSLVGCDKCVRVTINPPKSHLKSKDTKLTIPILHEEVYPLLIYTISVMQPDQDTQPYPNLAQVASHENFTTVVKHLLPSTKYCVAVTVSASSNLNMPIQSAWKCATTKSDHGKGWNVTNATISAISVFVILIGFLSLIGLNITGYICFRKNMLPSVLTLTPKSESVFYENPVLHYAAAVATEESLTENQDHGIEREYRCPNYSPRRMLDNDQGDRSGQENSDSDPSGTPPLAESSGPNCGFPSNTGASREPLPVLGCDEMNHFSPVKLNINPHISCCREERVNIDLHSVLVGDLENLWIGSKDLSQEKSRETNAALNGSEDPPTVYEPRLFVNILKLEIPRTQVLKEHSLEAIPSDNNGARYSEDPCTWEYWYRIALVAATSSAPPPPWNVQLVSKNFQHVLTWENNNTCASVFYCCYFCGNSQWVPVDKCSNISSQICVLTEYLTRIHEYYTVRVQSCDSNVSSKSVYLTPIEDTMLGPPLVGVIGGNQSIKVKINPPVSSIGKEQNVSMLSNEVYPVMTYTIMVVQPGKSPWPFINLSKEAVHENYVYVIKDLLPNTNYCVSVSVSTSNNLNGPIASELKCATTNKDVNVDLIIVCTLVSITLIGLVLLLIALDKAGYLFFGKHFTPKVLKHLTKSESIFYENTEACHQACVVPVVVKQKTEEARESGYEDCDRGYCNRKKVLDSDQSAPLTSEEPLSVESSGQDSSSSTGVAILKELAPVQDAEESWPLRIHVPAAETDANLNLPSRDRETFNVNLNSVLVGDPESLWMDVQKAHPDTDREPLLILRGAGVRTGEAELGLFANGHDAQTIPESEDYCASEEDVNSDNGESDEHFVSHYMRRCGFTT